MQVVWAMYREAMRDAGFNSMAPLYVATGLLSYGAEQEFQSGVNLLISHQLCSEVLYKEQYLPTFELQSRWPWLGCMHWCCASLGMRAGSCPLPPCLLQN